MGGTLRDLVRRFHGTGRLGAIVLRPDRLKDAVSVQEARAEPGLGLIGDHRSLRLRQSDAQRHRELSLIQAEHLSLLGVWTGQAPIAPERLRRNLVISGINIAAMHSPFREERFVWRIGGSVRIEITGPCPPCSRMEDELGEGGYAALRGHGGATARIVVGGVLRVGDTVNLDVESTVGLPTRPIFATRTKGSGSTVGLRLLLLLNVTFSELIDIDAQVRWCRARACTVGAAAPFANRYGV